MFCNKNLVSVEKEKKNSKACFILLNFWLSREGWGALDFDFAAVIRYLRELISVGYSKNTVNGSSGVASLKTLG